MSGGHVPPPVAPTGHRHHHPQHHHHHIQHHLQHHLQHHHHPEHHPEHQPSPRAPPTVTCLWVLTPITASISLAIVCIAISTNQWLLTEEKMPNPNYNGTGDNEYLPKSTVSGLWTLCFTNPTCDNPQSLRQKMASKRRNMFHKNKTQETTEKAGEREMHCNSIEYFPQEEYSPDPNDSTMAIPYAVTRSAFFFIIATLLLFFGEFSCMYGHFDRSRRIFTFVSGVVFIISGLLMLIGSVMYISIFKAEIGSKLRPRSQLQPPLFTFSYGYSFLLYVSGFMAIETAGTCAVFLYIYWHQRDWGMKTLEMTNMNHHRKPSSSSVLLVDQHIYTGGPLYPCRRHPHYAQPIMSNHIEGLSPSLHQRRFYFENDPNDSPPISPNQRVSNVTSTYYSYPEAYQGLEAEGPVMGWDHLPRDLTTQTVSTTADIVNPCDDIGDYSPHPDFVTFDLDAVPPPRTPTHSLEPPNLVESLRRTTPV